MKEDEEEVCAVKVIRKTWKMLNQCKNLEEAKEKFKQLIIDLILS
jgi:hypothetical protein